MKTLWPFFTFYGGKWRAATHYPEPKHDTIIEPFAGSAGYSIRHADRNVILYDIDENICMAWDYLINAPSEEILALPDIENGQDVNDLSIAEEAKTLIGWWLNKGSSHPCNTPSSWMQNPKYAKQFWGKEKKERIASQQKYIRHWEIHQGSYEDCPDVDATWFIDPPYREKGVYYRFGTEQIDYSRLGAWCQGRRGQVIVCENEGATWLPFEPFMSIKGMEGKRRNGKSVEVMWYNETA